MKQKIIYDFYSCSGILWGDKVMVMNFKKAFNRLFRKSKSLNHNYFNIDSTAIIMKSSNFDFRVFREQKVSVVIGKDSMVGCNFIFESSEGFIKIGDRTFINSGTNLISRSSIEIGNDVTIGWGCYVYDHDSHSLNWVDRCEDIKNQLSDYRCGKNIVLSKNWSTVNTKPIKICDKVWIGFDAVILKGVTVGEGAVVAAKAVVAKDVEPWTVVAGNPAKVVKKIDPAMLKNEEKI